MFDSLLAVTSAAGIDDSYSRTFAQQHGLPWVGANELEADTSSRFTVALSFDERGCCLKSLVDRKLIPVRASFIEGAVNHRRQFGGGKGQMIAKAVGLKGRCLPSVLDATAGLGRDGFVLATLGCHVQLLERSPAIAALLQAGLEEASNSLETAEIAARMSVKQVNSIDFLLAQEGAVADVIYLDPMFPHREKSSLVKKEMRIFRDIVGDDLDAQALLAAARDKARYRVVVKRPRKAPVIEGGAPSFSLEGKSSRYDIYTIRSLNEWQPQEG